MPCVFCSLAVRSHTSHFFHVFFNLFRSMRRSLANQYNFVTQDAAANLFPAPYFIIAGLSAWSTVKVSDESKAILDRLGHRVVFLGQRPLSSKSGALYSMIRLCREALSRHLFQFGMGVFPKRTAATTAAGLSAISAAAPAQTEGRTPSLYFDANGRALGTISVFTLDGNGDFVDFASVLSDGNIAVFDFALLGQLRRPTVQDYLQIAGNSGSGDGSTESAGSRLAVVVAVPMVSVILLAALILLVLWRRTGHGRAYNFEKDIRALPLGNRPFAAPLEVCMCSLKLGKELGRGSFGRVHLGTLRGRGVVAVKVGQHDHGDGEMRRRMLREMLLLAQFRSEPCIVRLEAVVTRGPVMYMAMEYCHGGSLVAYLAQGQAGSVEDVTWAQRLTMARDVASGMVAVHAAGYLHMDLSARNVLVTDAGRCKVCDFGLAAEALYYQASSSRPMAVRWMAPEVLGGACSSRASDVWSFGILLFEVATFASVVPYAGLSAAAAIAAVMDGRHVDAGYEMPPEVRALLRHCTAPQREVRPTFAELRKALSSMARHACAEPTALEGAEEGAKVGVEAGAYEAGSPGEAINTNLCPPVDKAETWPSAVRGDVQPVGAFSATGLGGSAEKVATREGYHTLDGSWNASSLV